MLDDPERSSDRDESPLAYLDRLAASARANREQAERILRLMDLNDLDDDALGDARR